MGVRSTYLAPNWLDAPAMRRGSQRVDVYACIHRAGEAGITTDGLAKALLLTKTQVRNAIAKLKTSRRPSILAWHPQDVREDAFFTADRILQHLQLGELQKAIQTLYTMHELRKEASFEVLVSDEIIAQLDKQRFRVFLLGLAEPELSFIVDSSISFLRGLFDRTAKRVRIINKAVNGFDISFPGQVVNLDRVRHDTRIRIAARTMGVNSNDITDFIWFGAPQPQGPSL